MFARATSGDKKNNRQFSPCSLKSVKKVLLAKARGHKGCFSEPKMALCGNGVVEEGEECDCGWEEDCAEKCCWPQTGLPPEAGRIPCTLRPKMACSPTQGPCCTAGCEFAVGSKCRDDNGCRDESFCDGFTAACPASDLKPNKTVCNEEYVCYKVRMKIFTFFPSTNLFCALGRMHRLNLPGLRFGVLSVRTRRRGSRHEAVRTLL